MKINPAFALSVPALVVGVLILWRVFHHEVSDLASVDAQPPGKYFLLLKETGPGQHDAAIVVKNADGKQTVLRGVAKGDINSPVGNQRLITYSPTGCEGVVVELLQFGASVRYVGAERIDPACSLSQELTEDTVLKKL